MKVTIPSSQANTCASTAFSPARCPARLTFLPGLWLVIAAGLFSGCAGYTIDIPKPALPLLPQTGSMVVAVPDTSYREVTLGLQLRKQLRKSGYYSLPKNKDLEQYLFQTGRTIQELWNDPKLAKDLTVDMVLTPKVIEWKTEESMPKRRVIPDSTRVVQYCWKTTGTLRSTFTFWRVSDGVKLFEDEVVAARTIDDCDPDLKLTPAAPAKAKQAEPQAEKRPMSASGPDPFVTGKLVETWEIDPLFESVVKRAVASFLRDIDPAPYREVYIYANDKTGYESGRQLVKARTHLRDEEWEAAITVLEQNLIKHPDSYASQYLIGVAQQGKRDFESAKKSYQQALTLCQSKQQYVSSSEAPPECGFIEEACKYSQAWTSESQTKNIPGAE